MLLALSKVGYANAESAVPWVVHVIPTNFQSFEWLNLVSELIFWVTVVSGATTLSTRLASSGDLSGEFGALVRVSEGSELLSEMVCITLICRRTNGELLLRRKCAIRRR